jgi:hypothetical protein
MKNEKEKTRKLILTSGLTWLFLLDLARSHNKLKLEDTLEKYIFGIASQTFNNVFGIGGTSVIFILLMCVLGYTAILIFSMAAILTLITIVLIIHNGIKANLTISETVKLAYLYIRKTIYSSLNL